VIRDIVVFVAGVVALVVVDKLVYKVPVSTTLPFLAKILPKA